MEDKVLETVVNGIKYTMLKDVLVKPLEPVMVTKEITEQIPTGEVDEDGFNKYDTQTETKEVESEYKVGDTIVYNKKFAKDFDLFKDSQLVKPYDIIAISNTI